MQNGKKHSSNNLLRVITYQKKLLQESC